MVPRTVVLWSKPIRYWWDKHTYLRSGNSEKLSSLMGALNNKPVVIVGNGPSLLKTPLEDFSGASSIGLNKIDLIYSKTSWRPSIVVCVNNLVAAQNWRSWLEHDIPVYLSWKCRHAIPRKHWDNFIFFLSLSTTNFQSNISSGVGSSGTVTFAALQFAFYMGADPVVLVGVDHSFKGAKDGRENAIETRKGADVDHFDPNYFASGQRWGLPNLDLSEQGYAESKEAFERDGRTVLDATVEGKLQIFRKIDVNEAAGLVQGS